MQKLSNLNLANAPSLDSLEQADIVWAMLGKIGSKQADREKLADGGQHSMRLLISGEIDGQIFEQSLVGNLSIGHAQQRATSATPQLPQLLAYILGKLNAATRDRILVDVPHDFRENGQQLPEVDTEMLKQTERLLSQLRQSKTVTARGNLRCEYTLV
jgi:hypothetical protein